MGTVADFSTAPGVNSATVQDVVGGVTVGTIGYSSANTNFSRTFTLTNGITLNQDGAGSGVATISNTNSAVGTNNAMIFSAGGTLTLADDLLISNSSASTNTIGAIQIISAIAGTGNITLSNAASNSVASGTIRFQTAVNSFTGTVLVQKGITTYNKAETFGNSASNTVSIGQSGQGSATLLSTAGVVMPNNIVAAVGSGGTLLLGSTSTGSSGYSGTVLLNDTLTLTSAGTTTFSGVVSGTGGIAKVDTGTVVLSNANTFSGLTTVSAGSINLANAAALQNSTASGALIFDSGVTGRAFTLGGLTGSTGLTLANTASTPAAIALSVGNNNAATTYSGVLSGSGSLIKVGTGTLTLSGQNTFTGGLTINGGAVSVSSSLFLGPATSVTTINNASTLAFTGAITSASTKTFVLGGTGGGRIDANVAATSTTQLNGAISGTGGFTKGGAGILYLGGATNTFTGGTTINAGTLQVATAASLGDAANTTTVGPATLYFYNDGSFITNSTSSLVSTRTFALTNAASTLSVGGTQAWTINGTVSGAGTLNKIGTGTLTVSGVSSHTGGTTVNAGTLSLTGANTTTGTTTLTAGTLSLGDASALGTGPLALNGGTINSSKSDLTLTTNNAVSLGGDVAYAATYSLDFGAGAVTLTGNRTITTASNGSARLRFGGGIAGNYSLTKNGPGILSINGTDSGNLSTFTGGVFLNAGQLTIVSGGSLGANPSTPTPQLTVGGDSTLLFAGSAGIGVNRTFAINTGTTLTINTNGYSVPLNNTITGGGALTKSGTSSLVLSNANYTYSGGTTITNGSIVANAPSFGTGPVTFNPGSGITANVVFANMNANVPSVAIAPTAAGTSRISLGYSIAPGGPTTLTIGSDNSNTAFAGQIVDYSGTTATAAAVGSIIKAGSGTLTLSGANTYTGTTTVSAGVLRAENATSSLGTGNVAVNGGTLAGSGRTGNGGVTVASGGTISAGTGSSTTSTPGKLTVGGTTTLAGGSTYAWKVANPANGPTAGAGTNFDLLSLATLNVDSGGGVIIKITGANATPAFADGQSFLIATSTAAQIGGTQIDNTSPSALAGFASLFTLTTDGIDTSGSSLTLSAVADGATGVDLVLMQSAPEPTTAVLVGLGGAAVLGRRRRRAGGRSLWQALSGGRA